MSDGADIPLADNASRVDQLASYHDKSGSFRMWQAGSREYPRASVHVNGRVGLRGGVSVSLRTPDSDWLLGRVLELCAICDPILARVEDEDEPIGRRSETASFLDEQARGFDAARWPRYILGGLAYRTVLGRELVEEFGVERLEALGSDVAWQVDGQWVIAGAESPEDSFKDRRTDREQRILDQLGASDLFIDPASNYAFPDRWLSYGPPVFPVALRDLDEPWFVQQPDGSITDWNGGVGFLPDDQVDAPTKVEVDERRDSVDAWNAMREAYADARAIQVQAGYVPKVVWVQSDERGGVQTACLIGPGIDYVIPDVQVVLYGERGDQQRWIDRDELDAVLGDYRRIEADHMFTHDGVDYTCGMAHYTDDTSALSAATHEILATLGTTPPTYKLLDPS